MGCSQSTPPAHKTSSPIAAVPLERVKFNDVYQVGDILGQGSYSVVKKATRISDNTLFAVKIVTRSKLQRDDEINLKREVEILRSLNHPHIVKVMDFFEEDQFFYVVLEYLSGGELFDRLMEKAVYTEGEARDLAVILLETLQYCHDRDIVHRDVKPENILLVSRDSDIDLKLADFGFAVKSSGPPSIKQQAGTPGYIAPEVIEGKPHGKPVDMWSMGVILYMLLGGYPPFYEPEDDQKAMFRKILAAKYEFHADTWDVVSSEAKDMIRGLLTLDPQRRLTAAQCLAHPWIGKSRTDLVVHNLNQNMVQLRNFKAARVLQVGAASANIAIDVIRHLSGANLSPGFTINDAAITVMRKISGASLNDIAVDSARKRSSANFYASSGKGSAQTSRQPSPAKSGADPPPTST